MGGFLWYLIFRFWGWPQGMPYPPEVKFKMFLENLKKNQDDYYSFIDGIYSSLNSSLHLINTDGYIKL